VPLKVFFRPRAEADLSALYHYIAEMSGPVIAGNYAGRDFESDLRGEEEKDD